MAEDRIPKPDGYGFALMKDHDGNYSVVKLKLKGKQIQAYETIHPETNRSDAKRQIASALARFLISYDD